MNRRIAQSAVSIVLLASGFTIAGNANASAAEVVYQPIVENGETEIEMRNGWRTFDGGHEEHASILELGRGVTDHWFTEVELEQSFENGGPNHLESLEWENIFALTERGKYWMDFGLFASYEHTFSMVPDVMKIGPMFMKDIGPVTANVNLLFERELGNGASHATGLGYTWQLRWHGSEAFEVGAQGFGELGVLGHLGQDQSHIAGPAIFGLKRFGRNTVKWNAAVLGGLDRNAPDVTVRTQIEIEMH
ncbi:MAG TPA: hypothetical protein VGT79_08765 [Xanthomonadaceae bacterium]|nr:hypothetical protein [Xanthomonadaceae bacterium]